mmetsp:Transcript_5045/g.7433  ORF Transcript_5045/g.7433 Transcript_5045/m.7433 type:complete len:90 (+) Transcript_5045:630-899(+)
MSGNMTKFTTINDINANFIDLMGEPSFFIMKFAKKVPTMQNMKTITITIPVSTVLKPYSTRNVTDTTEKEFTAASEKRILAKKYPSVLG